MMDNSAYLKVVKTTRLLAIAHIIVGILLLSLGIVHYIVALEDSVPGTACFGIWIGIWMCITGAVGFAASRRREITGSCSAFIYAFMVLAVLSAVLVGIMIIMYAVNMHYFARELRKRRDRANTVKDSLEEELSVTMLTIGVAAFTIGVCTAVCCYWLQRDVRHLNDATPFQPRQQVVYTANPAECVKTEGPAAILGAVSARERQPPTVYMD